MSKDLEVQPKDHFTEENKQIKLAQENILPGNLIRKIKL
jgi:hypothetical protein